MRTALSESWRCADAETPPEGTDPLFWELGQLRKLAQDALARAARTGNLQATASLLRSANGLLDLLARIEKAKAEELKAQHATAALQQSSIRRVSPITVPLAIQILRPASFAPLKSTPWNRSR